MAAVGTSQPFAVAVTTAAATAARYTSNPFAVRVASVYFMQRVGTQLVPARACVRIGDQVVDLSPGP